MRPSSPLLAASSSLAGAFVGAAVALQLGVVELPGADGSSVPAPAGAPAVAVDASGVAEPSATGGTRPLHGSELRERRATVETLRLLHRWDARRERAWERGDAASLARLYTARSVAGRRDVALLERYAARGWTVDGTTPRVVDAAVTGSGAGRVRLRVSEVNPAAGPSRHVRVVTLVRSTSGWRVGRVTAG